MESALYVSMKCFNDLPSNWNIDLSISNEAKLPSELIRWGLDWNKFSKNFKTYLNHSRISYICLSPTPTIFSIKHMYEYFEWVFDLVRKTNKKCMVYGNWIRSPEVLDPARSSIKNRIYIDKLENLFLINKDIFNSDNNPFAINWLKKLKNRIGTIKQNEKELKEFLDNMASFKQNKKIYELMNYVCVCLSIRVTVTVTIVQPM